MPLDQFAAKGSTKASRPDAGKANLRNVPVIGIVKDTVDPIKTGRIQVYIDDLGGNDPDNRDSWITVSYLSPFYGLTPGSGGQDNFGTYKNNPSSYGMWYSAPDIGTKVVCIFINGDPNYGFWIGCIPEPEALYMVPAIGSYGNVILNSTEAESYGGAARLPVVNINTNNEGLSDSSNFLNQARPVHSFQASIMNQQGILRDPVRGPIGSSAQRESPSRVGWGVSTPGRPIYEGGFSEKNITEAFNQSNQTTNLKVVSRRGGHTFVMDDGDIIGQDQLIRIRTALGHQILLSDSGQTLMILHSNGQSYIELGKEGTIDMFSTNSVNIRTQGDLNLHADNDININAKKKLNVYAENVNLEAEKNVQQKTGADHKVYTKGKYTHRVEGAMSMAAIGEASFFSKAVTYINGSKVNLNTGATSVTPEVVPPIPQLAQTDTLYDPVKGFAAAPGLLQTIVSRAPAHCPWANAGQGVNVKTNLSAAANLPSTPNNLTTNVNVAAGAPNVQESISVATASTVPPVNAASAALNQNVTSAAVSAAAKLAATGPGAAAITAGTAIANMSTGVTAVVGKLAQTPAQLASNGVLKPGSQVLAQGLIDQGVANANVALTSNLFKGISGAENLPSFLNELPTQVKTLTNNLQKAQTSLTQQGIITGKEPATAIAGLVLSGATAGIKETVDSVKNSIDTIANLPNSIDITKNAATQAIAAGNFAANIAENVMGGLGGISNAVNQLSNLSSVTGVLDLSKGAAGAAFGAITNAFKPLKAGVPQNLKALLPSNIKNLTNPFANLPNASNVASGLSNIGNVVTNASQTLKNGITAIPGLVGSSFGANLNSLGSSLANTASSALNDLTSPIKQISGITASASSAIASGVDLLPGGIKSISTVVNSANLTQSFPRTEILQSAIAEIQSAGLTDTPINSPLATAIASAGLGGLDATQIQEQLANANVELQSTFANLLGNATNTLSSTIMEELPIDLAAELGAALSSTAAGGPSPIKLPAIGLNTNDRSSLEAQTTSLLGDPKIPIPDFDFEVSEASVQGLAQIETISQQTINLVLEIAELQEQVSKADTQYRQAIDTFPAGDPSIVEARLNYDNLVTKLRSLQKQLDLG